MEVEIKTPIWTGDVDQKSEFLQSTGIVGSLRWWTEAILRSIDKYACDPTGDGRCPDEKGNEKYYCSACLIFGATGIRRMFKLDVNGGKHVFTGSALNIKPSGRNKGWYLGSGVVGKINLKITSLDRDFDESLILLPLIIASNWGGIGAKTQHGYGVIKIEDCPRIDFTSFREDIEKVTNQERLSKLRIKLRYGSNNELPDLREMFFAKIQFEAENGWWRNVDGIASRSNDPRILAWIDSGSVPIVPAVKNWLRYGGGTKLWKTTNQNQNERIENWLFGTTEKICSSCYGRVRKNKSDPRNFWCPNCNRPIRREETFERIASKINVSCAYPVSDNLWEFRIWGWIPKNKLSEELKFNREDFLTNLKQALSGSGHVTFPWSRLLGDQTKNHKLRVWREFKPSEDAIKPSENNVDNYVQSLLEEE